MYSPLSTAVSLRFLALILTLSSVCIHAAEPTLAEKAFTNSEPVLAGKFDPSWESLHQYQFPEWFQDAKFGIWAHWGPQCQPEEGDWYARNMYKQYNKKGEPSEDYVYHVAHYGHPSVFGFKDIIPLWKAEHWDPAKLIGLYKKAGAKYFMALANHHDNFDTWDSKYQPWNSVKIGPHKDLIAGWEKATRDAGMHFGVSVHAARAWGWNDGTLNNDKDGPKAGVQYDGRLTAADGKGLWWEGLDPQDLYSQNHDPKEKPSPEYMRKFYNRTMDLINKYHPDMIYFDDDISRGLPLYGDDPSVGLRIAAHLYNDSMKQHGGTNEAVIAAKKLSDDRKQCLLYDIERGGADAILPEPWQTDTCIGQWHYSKSIGKRNGYKKSSEVIRMLADIVSKNGNLMLSIPVRSDGSIDDNEVKFLEEMGIWMSVNGEAIYATRPWKVFGEGPPREEASTPTTAPAGTATQVTTGATVEVKEKKLRPLGAEDIRFTRSKDGKTLYAIVLGTAAHDVQITALANEKIVSVDLLGSHEKVTYSMTPTALAITKPTAWPSESANVFRISLQP